MLKAEFKRHSPLIGYGKMSKLYFVKFSLISIAFSIFAVVMHLFPRTDLFFMQSDGDPVLNKHQKPGSTSSRRGKADGQAN